MKEEHIQEIRKRLVDIKAAGYGILCEKGNDWLRKMVVQDISNLLDEVDRLTEEKSELEGIKTSALLQHGCGGV